MDLMKLKVSIIIPNFNGKELLARSLPEVMSAYERRSNNIAEIIVVDDNSSDDSLSFIKKNFPRVKLIKHRVNRGFSSSINTGVRKSEGNIICLLNNDVIPKNNFLLSILPHFSDDSVFGVSMHEQGYGWARGYFENGYILHKSGKEIKESRRTFWVSGGSGCFRKDYWLKLNGFDEKLYSPFYWEDVDLSYRAQKRGFILIWEPNSIVTHKHQSTIKNISKTKRSRIEERNQLIFIWKNLTSTNLFKKHISGLLQRMAKHPGYIRIVILALLKYRDIRKARLKEKRECKVSDEAIFASY